MAIYWCEEQEGREGAGDTEWIPLYLGAEWGLEARQLAGAARPLQTGNNGLASSPHL